MDDGRFDAMTKSLTVRGVRRGFLAAVAGWVLAAVGDADAAAKTGRGRDAEVERRRKPKPKPKPRRCTTDAECAGCGACRNGRCVADDARCPDCKRCNPRTFRCEGGCGGGKLCCDGSCQEPGPLTCCTDSRQCGGEWGCLHCVNGRCQPKPNGRECGDCKRCKDGSCTEEDPNLLCGGVCCQANDQICVGQVFKECCDANKACTNDCCADDEHCTEEDGCCPRGRACGPGAGGQFRFERCCGDGEQCVGGTCCPDDRACGNRCCPEDHRCAGNGRCCRACVDGLCCRDGFACIDPGPLSPNTCCDRSTHTPCGDNGDGTFAACCSNRNEVCRNGACAPRGECVGGRPPCGGRCCEADEVCSNGTCIPDRCPDNGTICPRVPGGCCGQGEVCAENGCCRVTDVTGFCDNRCTDLLTDPNHCGGCHITCRAGEVCCNGDCTIPPLQPCTMNGERWCCGQGWKCCWVGGQPLCCHPDS